MLRILTSLFLLFSVVSCKTTHLPQNTEPRIVNTSPYSSSIIKIDFDFVGENNFNTPVFFATHVVSFSPKDYKIEQAADFRLIGGGEKVFVSEGEISQNKLLGRSFKRIEKDTIVFDVKVESETVSISQMGRDKKIPAKSNTLIYNDYLYQLMAFQQPNFNSEYSLLHAYGYEAETKFVYLGEELLDTKLGRLKTHKFRYFREGNEEEVWLSSVHKHAPVQFTTYLGQTKLIAKASKIEITGEQ